jgi:DEAD/DEAH box helicase
VVPNSTYDVQTQTAWLNGVSISRADVREMFHKTTKKLYDILETKIYKNRRKDVFTASKSEQKGFDRSGGITDTPSSPHFGYSYLTANKCFMMHKDGLRNLFIHDPAFRGEFLLPFLVDNKPVWNLSAIDKWIADVDNFKSHLAALVYWLSGMPPRGVEFTATLVYNITNAQRNIYSAQGDLVLEHTYSKSEASTGHSRPVMRQPPHALQQALEEYIVVVKDVYDLFVAIRNGDHADTSPEYRALLWTYRGRQMTTDHLSQTLRTISMGSLGQSIGIRAWRQFLLQFSHNILPKAIIQLPLTVTALSSQASHGPTADRANYDRQTDTTFAQVNSSQFLEYRCVSLAWQEAWGFAHPTRKSGAIQPGEVSSIRQETEFITSQLSQQINFNIVPLVEASVARAVAETRAREIINSPYSCRFAPLDLPVTPEALSLINRLHQSNQGFRSVEQAMCVQYAMERGATPLFVVHPMGHGKSSIYLAPMIEERGTKTTLLLVPLLSLAQSAETVATTHGFNAKFFNPSENSPRGKQEFSTLDLVIMTYDLLIHNPTIVTWFREMAAEKRLSRIVVDEAHTLVTEEHYRTNFTRIYSALASFAVPNIFLSGTMPESACAKILECFQNYRTVLLSRLPGDRNNLAYSVDATLGANNDSIEDFASLVKTELYPKLEDNCEDRILIFSRTVDWAERIAAALGCNAYTSKADLESKQEQLLTWLSSTEPGIENVSICHRFTK